MRFNKYFITAAALAIVFFFNISSVLASGPGGAVSGLDTNFKLIWTDTTHYINMVRFAPDDSYIISSGRSDDLRIYNVSDGKQVNSIKSRNGGEFSGFKFSRSGKYIVSEVLGEVEIYDAKTFAFIKSLKDTASWFAGDKDAFSVDISPDDKYISLASRYNFYTIWEWQTGKVVKREEFPLKTTERTYEHVYIDLAGFSLDSKYLFVSGAYTYTINNKQYSTSIMKFISTTTWDTTTAKANIGGRFSRSGKTMGYYASGKIKLFSNETNALIREIPTVVTNNMELTISSDDKYVIVNPVTLGESHIYRIDTGELLIKYYVGGQHYPDVSLDNRLIVSSIGPFMYLYYPPWLSIGVPEPHEPLQVIYPNPANGVVNISLQLQKPLVLQADIYDSRGTKIKATSLGICSGDAVLNIENVPSGAYPLLISGEGYNKAFRMVVAR